MSFQVVGSFVAGILSGGILSYAFHKTIQVFVKKAESKVEGKFKPVLADLKSKLTVLYGRTDVEVGKFKDELKAILVDFEKEFNKLF